MRFMTSQRVCARWYTRFAAAILSVLCLGLVHAAETVSGRFELIDHHGEAVTEASFDGKYRLVFFGFTRCPVICPTTMIEVTRVMNALGDQADRVQPLFITIDPDNDTVDVVASYVKHFHPAVVGLTGSKQQIADAAKSFNVTFGGTDAGTDDNSAEIYHSSYLYLMNEDGSFLDIFGYGAKAATIVEAVDKHLSTPVADLRIVDPWASEPAGPMANVIAGFMCIQNDGSSPLRIVDASSEAVERVEIHEIVHEQGIVSMKKLDGLDIPANGIVCLEPERVHFMLMGIDDTIRAGANVRLQIHTASGDKQEAVLPQRSLIRTE